MKKNSRSEQYMLVADNIPFGEYRLTRGDMIRRDDAKGQRRYGRLAYDILRLIGKHYYVTDTDQREALLSRTEIESSFYHCI